MNLKDFTKQTLREIVEGVDEISQELSRDVKVMNTDLIRSIEFDVAVTVSDKDIIQGEVEAGGQIKVIPFLGGIVKGKGELGKETLNSTVTRIKFGINVDHLTKSENQRIQNQVYTQNQRSDPYY